MEKNQGVRFIKRMGRIIPIFNKNKAPKKPTIKKAKVVSGAARLGMRLSAGGVSVGGVGASGYLVNKKINEQKEKE